MSHLQRVSWILGTLLIGLSAALLYQREGTGRRVRRASEEVPVDKLAENLKQAWAGYHTP